MKQKSRYDFLYLKFLLEQSKPFTFVRFSDGEMEIIKNQRLFIGGGKVIWSKGTFDYNYPEFDQKDFMPERDKKLRDDLIKSAEHQAENFFKGVPASHNNAFSDQKIMITLNGNSKQNLTFADLLINQNFLRFRRQILPILRSNPSIYVIANFRSNPKLFNINWTLISLQDNFFPEYEKTLETILNRLENLPPYGTVLSSASSLSNILGYKLNKLRPDVTFIDIGTSMHDLFGLTSGIRQYHDLLHKNNAIGIYKKARLVIGKGYRPKW